MNLLVLYSVLLAFQLIIIFTHSAGLYLLRCLREISMVTVQQLHITNLSSIELTLTLCYTVFYILHILTLSGATSIEFTVYEYINITIGSILTFLYYVCMIYIIVDNFLEVYLNIRYQLYWDACEAKCLICFTWAVGIIFWISIMIAYEDIGFEYHQTLSYFQLTLDLFFVFLAVISYCYIFYKYPHVRNNPQQVESSSQAGTRQQLNIFSNSKFYVPMLLVLSFLLLTVFSDLANFFILHNVHDRSKRFMGKTIVCILHHVSHLTHSLIYIYFFPPVKRSLYTKLKGYRIFKRIASNNSEEATYLNTQLTLETTSL